jgi:hypothetical protein
MSNWMNNPIMEWSTNGGTTWNKISDHGRSELSVSVERIENKQRMANGRMRKYVVAKKRTWSCSWENLPSVDSDFLAGGKSGSWIENFHNTVDGSFLMRLRAGSEIDANYTGIQGTIVEVFISDFSKDVIKRGKEYDRWNLSISLEEA